MDYKSPIKKLVLLNPNTKTVHMRKIVFIYILVFASLYSSAQSISWLWANNAGNEAMNETLSIAKDNIGNTYALGYFSEVSLQLGSFNLSASGLADILLIKYDQSGNIVWATSAGKVGNDYGNSVHCDVFGNVWITGSFESATLQFGSVTLINSGVVDFYIAKYDSQGNPVWAGTATGLNEEYGNELTSDSLGNIYVSGTFNGTIDFGNGPISNSGGYDIFLAKYFNSGGLVWAKKFDSFSSEDIYDMEVGPDGFLYMTGYFYTSPIIFGQDTLTSAGSCDAFLVKADTAGDVQWAKSFGGTGDDFSLSISTTASGLIYLGGNFTSDPMTFDNTSMANSGFEDLFIIQCDTSGNLNWSKSAGGLYYETIWSLSADTNGNVYTIGFFSGFSLTLDSITMNITFPPLNSDVFVAGYDIGGNVLWATSLAGSSEDYGYDIVTHSNGMICVVGNFMSPSLTLGQYVLPRATLSPGDIFMAALSIETGLPDDDSDEMSGIIFPNPVADIATLKFPENYFVKLVVVYDMQGRKILQINDPSKHEIEIDFQTIANGMYTVQWVDSKGKSNQSKIVVNRNQ